MPVYVELVGGPFDGQRRSLPGETAPPTIEFAAYDLAEPKMLPPGVPGIPGTLRERGLIYRRRGKRIVGSFSAFWLYDHTPS